MLLAARFPEEKANRPSTIYEHGRFVLRAAPKASREMARLRSANG
jgi:hypothetical protein